MKSRCAVRYVRTFLSITARGFTSRWGEIRRNRAPYNPSAGSLLFQKSVACTIVTIASHNFALRSRFSNAVPLFPLNCIDDVAASTAFQMEEPELDTIRFRRYESANLALMTFSGRTDPPLPGTSGRYAEAHPVRRTDLPRPVPRESTPAG